jgi:putative membrane protein
VLVRLLVRFAANAVALYVAAWLLSGVTYGDQWWTLLVAAAVFTLVNMWLRPVVRLLSLPFIILTLGLLIFVINALMLLLTSWITGKLDVQFHVTGFGSALLGSLVITLVGMLLNMLLPDEAEIG